MLLGQIFLRISVVTIILTIHLSLTTAQVCSPTGQLCSKSTDCCKGCCENHSCVDRPFSCSADMVAQPGYNSCEKYVCPSGHFCYLREVCAPENPCPRQPRCRKIPVNIDKNRTSNATTLTPYHDDNDTLGYFKNNSSNKLHSWSWSKYFWYNWITVFLVWKL